MVENNGKTESIGAKVWLQVSTNQQTVEDSKDDDGIYFRNDPVVFLGQAESIAHFGLGKLDRKTVDKITIRWPGDIENTTIRNVPIRQTIVVRRRANREAYDVGDALHQARMCSVKLRSTRIVEAPEHGRVDTNGSILSKSEIRYTSNFDSLSDKFKVVSTFSSGEVLVLSVNVNVSRKVSSAYIAGNNAKQTHNVGKAIR